MLLKRNLLETVTILSCTGTAVCIFLNYATNISPITGIWFITYISLLFITSIVASFKFMQWLLHLNKPIKYDVEGILKKYPFLTGVLPRVCKKVEKEQSKEYDTNELSIITTVLEKRLVSSWYVSYISEEIGFPFACKQMLDQMIAKAFQVSLHLIYSFLNEFIKRNLLSVYRNFANDFLSLFKLPQPTLVHCQRNVCYGSMK